MGAARRVAPAGALSDDRDCRRGRPSAEADGSRTPLIRPAAAPAARHDPTDASADTPTTTCSRNAGHWDPATRRVVLARVDDVPDRCGSSALARRPTLRAFCDVVLAQDRSRGSRSLELVDAKLAAGRLDGYRYADMPDDRETWRLVARAGWTSRRCSGAPTSFAACAPSDAGRRSSATSPRATGGGAVGQLTVERAWSVVHARRAGGVLLPSVGVERDRLRRPGLPAGLHAARRPANRRARAVGGPRGATQPIRMRRRHRDGMSAAQQPAQGRPDAAGQRFGLPARPAHARPAGPATDAPVPDGDEVDLVVVGAGAGGSRARPAARPARLADRDPRARAVLGSRPGLGLRRGGRRTRSTGPSKRIICGDDPVELGKNNSGRGVGGSMMHYAGYTPRFHPSDFETSKPRRRRRGLADRLLGPQAALRAGRAGAAGRRTGLAVG